MKSYYCLLFVLSVVLCKAPCYAQRVYATLQTPFASSGLGNTQVKDPLRSVTAPFNSNSELEVDGVAQSAWQLLSFSTLIPPNTPITVFLEVDDSDLIAVGNDLTVQAYNNTTALPSLSSMPSLIALFSTSKKSYVTLTPGAVYNGIKVSASTLAGKFKVKIFHAFYIISPNVSAKSICSGNTSPLTINNFQTGYEYRWYDAPIGGTLQFTTNTKTANSPPLTSTTIYYVEAVESNQSGASSVRSPVVVIVNPPPSLASIAPVVLCPTQTIDLTTLNPVDNNGTTSGSYAWSLAQGSTPLSSTVINAPAGTATYWVRYTSNGCYDDQSVTVKTSPKPAPIVINLSTN